MYTHKHETHTEDERKHIHERDEMNTKNIGIVTVGTHVHGQRLYWESSVKHNNEIRGSSPFVYRYNLGNTGRSFFVLKSLEFEEGHKIMKYSLFS